MTRTAWTAVILLALWPAAARADEKAEVAAKTKEILEKHCYSCHGGSKKAAELDVFDIDAMVAAEMLVKGNAAKSDIWRKTKNGSMPKGPVKLTAEELATFRRWIELDAPPMEPPPVKRDRIDDKAVVKAIYADLMKLKEKERPGYRYLTLTHLYNAGIPDSRLDDYRHALSRLLNSLSWAKEIVRPEPIDPAKTIYRVRLEDYKWTPDSWRALAAAYPYGYTVRVPEARLIENATESQLPYVRGDWFAFAAARPPLYHVLLGIPKTTLELEKMLEVDVANNIARGRAARAGFNGSGVSRNNRLIERHDYRFGAYWKSYDFGSNDGRKNLFRHPLGPGVRDSFDADGGEIIFTLPNGLQGYMLTDGPGKRIDQGPVHVVSVKDTPKPEVINGISCMYCHREGTIPKTDQVRAAATAGRAFTAEAKKDIAALYPEKAAFDKLLEKDRGVYLAAVEKAGGEAAKIDVVVLLSDRFEAELDAPKVAAEFGLAPDVFLKKLDTNRDLAGRLGPLFKKQKVKREVVEEVFAAAVRHLDVGAPVKPAAFRGPLVVGPNAGGFVPDPSPIRKNRDGTRDVKNSIDMLLVPVAGGDFEMGSPGGPGRDDVQNAVRVGDFLMGVHEVTQAEYAKVMGTNPSAHRRGGSREKFLPNLDTDTFPVDSVRYADAVAFCEKLSALPAEKKAGRTYRLPTEAEWEYACRARTTTKFHLGDGLGDGDANFDASVPTPGSPKGVGLNRTAAVGSFSANDLNLCDMHGNVFEWCSDWYDRDTYTKGPRPRVNPAGPPKGRERVIRGGGFDSSAEFCRSGKRQSLDPSRARPNVGFRVVCIVKE